MFHERSPQFRGSARSFSAHHEVFDMDQPPRPYRVLSLDGGGMRGLYTASVLHSLMRRFAGSSDRDLDIGKGFDLIVGTSTGGILACGLVAGIPINSIMDIYRSHGREIFKDPIPRPGFGLLSWAFRNRSKPANDNKPLRDALTNIFGDEQVGRVFKRRGIGFCVNSVNVINHGARVFKTSHDPKKHADDDRTLVDVCMATSAAPIIFPIATIPDPEDNAITECFVDGGLWANNPVLVALVEAIVVTDHERPIEIVSIGTCPPPSGEVVSFTGAKRGLLDWRVGIRALELSMDAQASANIFISGFLAKELSKSGRSINIMRLQQSSPSSEQSVLLSLDNASAEATSTLVQLGSQDGKEICLVTRICG